MFPYVIVTESFYTVFFFFNKLKLTHKKNDKCVHVRGSKRTLGSLLN